MTTCATSSEAPRTWVHLPPTRRRHRRVETLFSHALLCQCPLVMGHPTDPCGYHGDNVGGDSDGADLCCHGDCFLYPSRPRHESGSLFVSSRQLVSNWATFQIERISRQKWRFSLRPRCWWWWCCLCFDSDHRLFSSHRRWFFPYPDGSHKMHRFVYQPLLPLRLFSVTIVQQYIAKLPFVSEQSQHDMGDWRVELPSWLVLWEGGCSYQPGLGRGRVVRGGSPIYLAGGKRWSGSQYLPGGEGVKGWPTGILF